MRFKLAVFLLILLLTLSAGVTAAVGLAITGPMHAGDPFFAFQDLAEQGVAALTTDDYNYAVFRMDLLERRIRDLDFVAGSMAELDVLDSLRWELEQSINGLTYLSEEQLGPLRARLVDDLTAIQAAFPRLEIAPQQVPDQWAALLSYVAELLARASDFSQPIGALVFEPNVAAFVIQPGAAASSLNPPDKVNPRAVRFPAGSVGAMHTFFPLDGRHTEIDCAACHANGRYTGTPVTCTACHTEIHPLTISRANAPCATALLPGSRPPLITKPSTRAAAPAVIPRTNPPITLKGNARCATARPPGSRPISIMWEQAPTAPPATPRINPPTTLRVSALCATARPPGNRLISITLPPGRPTAPPATPRINPPTTSPGNVPCATAPARGDRPLSAIPI